MQNATSVEKVNMKIHRYTKIYKILKDKSVTYFFKVATNVERE